MPHQTERSSNVIIRIALKNRKRTSCLGQKRQIKANCELSGVTNIKFLVAVVAQQLVGPELQFGDLIQLDKLLDQFDQNSTVVSMSHKLKCIGGALQCKGVEAVRLVARAYASGL